METICLVIIQLKLGKTRLTFNENGKKRIKFKEPSKGKDKDFWTWKEIQLPCGQCIGCRLDYAKNWATRIILEMKEHKHNYFVTVTYAPEHVPKPPKLNTETGQIVEIPSLDKRDTTLFIKKLREHFREMEHTGIRYFYCGEYGEKTERPHYHFIFFNLPLYDLEPFFINHEGQQVYRSKLLEEKWGLGIVSVGEVTYQSAAYVARYILKKQTGELQRKDRVPEFTEMSRRPGIGKNYYLQHKDEIYKNDEVIIKARLNKVVSMKPPRYFDNLYDLDDADALKEIKKKRRNVALMSRGAVSTYTTLNMKEYLEVCERDKLNHLKMLKRKMREDV